MTDEQLICWAAGFFDGEGCVAIERQRSNRKLKDGTPIQWISYKLGVSICQKDPTPLKIFHEMFGGHFYSYQVKGQTYWRWHTWSQGGMRALEVLRPYMILKPERAALGIEFQKSMMAWNLDYGRKGYPAWIKENLSEFHAKMAVFNKRGIVTKDPKTTGPGKGSANNFPAYADRKPRELHQKLTLKGDDSTVQ